LKNEKGERLKSPFEAYGVVNRSSQESSQQMIKKDVYGSKMSEPGMFEKDKVSNLVEAKGT
jgi:hypothetical protein